jgi:hypothetical protein
MNCNNLALAYKEAGELETSYAIATEGLSYSDFEELHFTRSRYLVSIGRLRTSGGGTSTIL